MQRSTSKRMENEERSPSLCLLLHGEQPAPRPYTITYAIFTEARGPTGASGTSLVDKGI